MAKPRYQRTKIKLTSHADIRFRERVPLPWEVDNEIQAPDLQTQRRVRAKSRRRLVSEIRKRLEAALRLGVEPDEFGAVHIFLEGGYEAVLVADVGCWTVLTILEPPFQIIVEEEGDVQQSAPMDKSQRSVNQ